MGVSVYPLVCFQCKPLSIQLISKASSFPDILGEYVSLPPAPAIRALCEGGVCPWAPRQAQGSGQAKARGARWLGLMSWKLPGFEGAGGWDPDGLTGVRC